MNLLIRFCKSCVSIIQHTNITIIISFNLKSFLINLIINIFICID